jgi:hypothetical protein
VFGVYAVPRSVSHNVSFDHLKTKSFLQKTLKKLKMMCDDRPCENKKDNKVIQLEDIIVSFGKMFTLMLCGKTVIKI